MCALLEKFWEMPVQSNIGSAFFIFALLSFLVLYLQRRFGIWKPKRSFAIPVLAFIIFLVFFSGWIIDPGYTATLGAFVCYLILLSFFLSLLFIFYKQVPLGEFRTKWDAFITSLNSSEGWKFNGAWVVVIFFSVVAFLIFLKIGGFLPTSGGSFKLDPIAGTGIEISYENKGIPESVSVISVPACRMATPTEVEIHPGDTIKISASGIVATALSYGWFPPRTNHINFASPGDVYTNIEEELREKDFNVKSDPDWRDARGNRIYAANEHDFATNSAGADAHIPYKLSTNDNYGALLGCVLPDTVDESSDLGINRAVLQAQSEQHVFLVGSELTIECKAEGLDKMRLHFVEPDVEPDRPRLQRDMIINDTQGKLYLLVNDVIVSQPLLTNFISNTNFSDDEHAFYQLTENVISTNTFRPQMGTNFDAFISELWYWDNSGIFTAIIKKTGSD